MSNHIAFTLWEKNIIILLASHNENSDCGRQSGFPENLKEKPPKHRL